MASSVDEGVRSSYAPDKQSVRISESGTDWKSRTSPSAEVTTPGTSFGSKTPGSRSSTLRGERSSTLRDRKIGHRRVDNEGQVTYKKKPTSELMAAIQLGIGQSITSLTTKPKRDLLLQDFTIVETVFFPSEGSNLTPAHHYSDFRFKTYAPIAFRYFRELFGIQPDDFLLSLCNDPLRELSNPGASGSIFYITNDDEFIIKTVQHKEAEFLQKLLPGYYMNLNQNPRTLLPKFYGLYCYQCGGKNIRFIVMNNLLPTQITLQEKYDLKGSTYKRKASKHERAKNNPTMKDLDFIDIHHEGLFLEGDTFSALVKTIERDCRVLQSFKIMDYSLLVGIHNLDAAKDKPQIDDTSMLMSQEPLRPRHSRSPAHHRYTNKNQQFIRGRSQKQRLANYSTAMESIQAKADPVDTGDDVPAGGIPARNSKGERLLLFMGVIDVLQSYRIKKKLEHAMKAMVHDGDTISVHRPGFYAQRFQNFFANTVFKKIPSPLKHSPSKKKPGLTKMRSITMSEVETKSMDKPGEKLGGLDEAGAVGGRPDLLPDQYVPSGPGTPSDTDSIRKQRSQSYTNTSSTTIVGRHEIMESRLHGTEPRITVETSRTPVGPRLSGDHDQHSYVLSSPVPSTSESTPTHTEYTEGTPSFTTSSPSLSSDALVQVKDAHSHYGGESLGMEQIELQVTPEKSGRLSAEQQDYNPASLGPSGPDQRSPGSPRSSQQPSGHVSATPPSSPSKIQTTSTETSYASAIESQTTLASSTDGFMSPDEEVR